MTTPPSPTTQHEHRLGLVTGATGYVGGRLVRRLLDHGWKVRVLTRSAGKLAGEPWGDRLLGDGEEPRAGRVQVCEGDAADADDVAAALRDVDVAWYLLHSMGEGDDFARTERDMAATFAGAATGAGVGRIVYLGGLHPEGELSEHLSSRVEVGQILLDSEVPTAALQAGVVLGADSSSFQMLRHLAERLPGAIGPDWLKNHIQPIGVDDLLHYLSRAADLAPDVNRTFDIGGPDALSYADMMGRYARAVGLGGRLVLTAPVTTPRAAARWIGLVTPVKSALAIPLVESLLHDTVVSERDLDGLVGPPAGGATTFEDAVRRASDGLDTRRWHKTLAATAAAVAATAVIGSLGTNPGSRWYRSLRTPWFQPPSWLFPVAWTALYADITVIGALSLADLAEEGKHEDRRRYMAALGANLVLNAGWSLLFFRGRRLRLSTVEAVALAASSADLVRRSAKVSVEKGVVLTPYAAWTAFAAVLTGAIAARNRRRR